MFAVLASFKLLRDANPMHQIKNFMRSTLWRRAAVPFGFALGGFFFYLAIRGIDWSEVRAQLRGVSVLTIVLAVGLMLSSGFLRALRWRFVFVDEPVSAPRLFLVENAAIGLNNVSPVRLLDEPAIVTMLTLRDRLPAATVLASLVTIRVEDLGITLAFAAFALLAEPTLQSMIVPGIVPSIFLVVALVGLLNLGWLTKRVGFLNRIPGIGQYEEAIGALMQRKRRLGGTVLLTGAYWLALGPMAYVLARGMDIETTLLQTTIIVLASITFATATPGLPGAFGTFELAVVKLSAIWGVPSSLAVGFGLILHLVLFLPPVIIALLVIPREGLSLWHRPRARSRQSSDP